MERNVVRNIKMTKEEYDFCKENELNFYSMFKRGINDYKNQNNKYKELEEKINKLNKRFTMFQTRMYEKEIEKKEI